MASELSSISHLPETYNLNILANFKSLDYPFKKAKSLVSKNLLREVFSFLIKKGPKQTFSSADTRKISA